MRKLTLTLALLAAAVTPLTVVTAAAQQTDSLPARALPRDVRREAERLWNGPAALRVTGALEIPRDSVVDGDVAVQDGPVTIAGRVRGRVLALNASVTLEQSARIDGDLLVIGGEVEGRDAAYVGGEIRIYRQRLAYSQEGDRITAEDASDDTGGWDRDRDQPDWRRNRSWSRWQIASAGAYNRVEGLPIELGPQVQRMTSWGRTRLDAYAVYRTGSSFTSTDNDVGYSVRTEVQLGRYEGFAFGGHAFDVVEGVEPWQLADLEVGLASFLLRRDYRDYYDKRGGSVFASLIASPEVSLTGAFSHEHWGPRDEANPFTLFRQSATWRPNPLMDEGVLHIANATLRIDTRNDRMRPWDGWYLVADYERGNGRLDQLGEESFAGASARRAAGPVAYSRGFLDFRRYNRIAPNAQLNLRLLAAGWLEGDVLPLQRRVSVEGSGLVPGFGFREPYSDWSAGTCGGPGAMVFGAPAECDRMAVAQAEYRGSINLGWDGNWDSESAVAAPQRRYRRGHADGVWVLFADAGRGWLVNTPGSTLNYDRGKLPPLSSFRTDVGAGFDFGSVGVYVAKALSEAGKPAHVFVRLRHRF